MLASICLRRAAVGAVENLCRRCHGNTRVVGINGTRAVEVPLLLTINAAAGVRWDLTSMLFQLPRKS